MRSYYVYARCNLPYGVCPYCGHVSRSVHSRYHRNIADLSILGHPVIITFEARKFFCHNPDCRKKTFAEQTKSCKASNVWRAFLDLLKRKMVFNDLCFN
ncbi:MAG: transposase family protein [Candidatus Cryptobacteroides sp.]|nr:transposase family protein [Bacteroidales bacterium]MDD7132805.1 transposase family protein [Bacteroidales bacterium]MDY2773496.1 transposase family protein [Candidatus Cryptobacteroides sp.]